MFFFKQNKLFQFTNNFQNKTSLTKRNPFSNNLQHMSVQSIIIDPGTAFTKAGLSDEPCLRSMFPTIVGRPKLPSIMVGMEHRDSYIGHEAQQKQNVLYLRNPIEHGFITKWEDMQQILHHIYYSELRVTPQEHPCMIAQSPKTEHSSRHKLTQIMFESMNVPSFYLSNQSVLSLFASGRTTGLVLDCGAGVTSSVPIYEGYAVPHAIRRNDFASNDIDDYIIDKLQRQQKIRLSRHLDRKKIEQIKQKILVSGNHECYKQNKKKTKMSHQKTQNNTFLLPDGNQIYLSSLNLQCGEMLFYPEHFGLQKYHSLQLLTRQTIQSCDKDIREDLFNNVILSGGTTKLHGFQARFQHEISILYPTHSIEMHCKANPQFLPWIGGSILSSLSTFQNMWVSRQQFLESGVDIIDKKCF